MSKKKDWWEIFFNDRSFQRLIGPRGEIKGPLNSGWGGGQEPTLLPLVITILTH